MKTWLVVGLCVVSFFFGAGVVYFYTNQTTTSNTNTNANANANAKSLNENQAIANADSSIAADNSCDETDIEKKVAKVKERIEKKIKDKDELSKQYEYANTDPNQPKKGFTVVVKKSERGNYVEAIVTGNVRGKDSLKDLSDILNDFKKDECLLAVQFVGFSPFEWIACQWPLVACPDGSCQNYPCPGGPGR